MLPDLARHHRSHRDMNPGIRRRIRNIRGPAPISTRPHPSVGIL